MKKLSRKTTMGFFIDRNNGFEKLESLWSELVNTPELKDGLPVQYHILYQVLRGKDYTKGFGEVTNESKLVCQKHDKQHAIRLALSSLRGMMFYNHRGLGDILDLFGTVVNEEGLKRAAKLLPLWFQDEPYNEVTEDFVDFSMLQQSMDLPC